MRHALLQKGAPATKRPDRVSLAGRQVPRHLSAPGPSLLSRTLPWEILLAVCDQADTPTLGQLCLVSFGLLKHAGPLLYRHVDITTPHCLHSFFIKPSHISSPTSRLRPHLGSQLVRGIHIDYRLMGRDQIEPLFPTTAWSMSDRRVYSPLRVLLARFEYSAGSCAVMTAVQDQISALILPIERQQVYSLSPGAAQPELPIDLEIVSTSAGPAPTVWRTRYLAYGGSGHLTWLVKDHRQKHLGATSFTMTVDFTRSAFRRRFSRASGHLRSVVVACVERPKFWFVSASLDMSLIFEVASEAAKKVAEDAIASTGSTDRIQRCKVVLV